MAAEFPGNPPDQVERGEPRASYYRGGSPADAGGTVGGRQYHVGPGKPSDAPGGSGKALAADLQVEHACHCHADQRPQNSPGHWPSRGLRGLVNGSPVTTW
jgi:hypothetical protein